MYRTLKLKCLVDWEHWMPNTIKKGCQEAKGLIMTIPKGSIGVYVEDGDLYCFEPVTATESRGFRVSNDPVNADFHRIVYASYHNFRPIISASFAELSISKGVFLPLDDNGTTTLF